MCKDRIESYKKKKLDASSKIINSFKKYCKSKGVVLGDEHFDYIDKIGVVAEYPDLLLCLDRKLKKDKEGLVSCSYLNESYNKKTSWAGRDNPFLTGYLYCKEYAVMASPLFRRGMGKDNNYTPNFISLFWSSFDNNDVESYLSLDYDRVRIDVDGGGCSEMDAWFGPKFTKNIPEIQSGPSRMIPPPEIDKTGIFLYFANVHFLDAKWKLKGDINTFQAEEIKTKEIKIERGGNFFHPVRYIHAEFDIKLGVFRHFDGAVHYYKEDEYRRRINPNFSMNSKSQKHQKPLSEKIFKINGSIEVDMWIEFCSHFLAHNPLIVEYFSGSLPEDTEQYVREYKKRYELTKDDGKC